MKYISLILLMMVVNIVSADIIEDQKTHIPSIISAPTGVVNRDRRTDASSVLLLGIVESNVKIVEKDPQRDVVEYDLGSGLVIDDPAYLTPIK